MLVMGDRPQGEPVTVTNAAVPVQAEMMIDALGAEGIEGFILAEGDEGIPIAVRPEDVAAAGTILSPAPPVLSSVMSAEANRFADKACTWSRRWWWCPPALILTVINLVCAIKAERLHGAGNPERFRRQVWLAFVVGIVLPVGGLAVVMAVAIEYFL